MTQYENGFTFIELMIVVTIISILAAVAIPAYSDYQRKAQVAESSLLIVNIKKAISDYYAYHGRLPVNNQAAGIPPAQQIRGRYVAQVEVTNGTIQVTFGQHNDEVIAGHTVSVQPQINDHSLLGIITWQCYSSLNDKKYLPKYCRK